MMFKHLVPILCLPVIAGCASMGEDQTGGSWANQTGQFVRNNDVVLAAGVGTLVTAQKLSYLKPEYLAGVLIGYAIYDPLSPTWNIQAVLIDENRLRFDLKMRPFVTGGEGEARQVFVRSVRLLVAEAGYAGFEEIRYEEGIESSRPFARRVASGEVRLIKSMQFPRL